MKRFCFHTDKAATIRAIETTYWNEISVVRSLRPRTERPNEPFRIIAGGNEVL